MVSWINYAWNNMKEFFSFIFGIICVLGIFAICVQGIFLLVGPDYKEGEYTMTYKVYYSPNDSRTYTIKNNWPISTYSSRGTNTVIKTIKTPYTKKMFRSQTVFESSAPIEVVSYKYKEYKQ